MRKAIVMFALLGLSACSGGGQPGAEDVTAGETQALDQAAEMVEQQRLPDEALRPPEQEPGQPAN